MNIENKLSEIGLTMSAKFVPISESRNAKKEYKSTDFSINWKITIFKSGREIFKDVDYMQGIGHLPAGLGSMPYTRGLSLHHYDNLKIACETGKYSSNWKSQVYVRGYKKLDPPSIQDIIYCLLSDSDVWNYDNFSDWCDVFGYDDDSISAKNIYDECMKTAITWHKNFSENEIDIFHDLFQDY